MNPNRNRRVGILCLWVSLAAAIVACSQPSIPEAPYDVLIRNGHILDGTGNPWYSGDVAIRDDRIAAIGSLENAKAKRVIDASGLVVSPGFIDMLGQSEFSLLIDNRSMSKLSQGITSEITARAAPSRHKMSSPLPRKRTFCSTTTSRLIGTIWLATSTAWKLPALRSTWERRRGGPGAGSGIG